MSNNSLLFVAIALTLICSGNASIEFHPQHSSVDRADALDSLLRFYNFSSIPNAHKQIRVSHKSLRKSIYKVFQDMKRVNVTEISEDLKGVKANFDKFIDVITNITLDENLSNEIDSLDNDLVFILKHFHELIVRGLQTAVSDYNGVLERLREIKSLWESKDYDGVGTQLGQLLDYLFAGRKFQIFKEKRLENHYTSTEEHNLIRRGIKLAQHETHFDYLITVMNGFGLNETSALIERSENDVMGIIYAFIDIISDFVEGSTAEKKVAHFAVFRNASDQLIDDVINALNNDVFVQELKSAESVIENIVKTFNPIEFVFKIIDKHQQVFTLHRQIHNLFNRGKYIKSGEKTVELLKLLFGKTEKRFLEKKGLKFLADNSDASFALIQMALKAKFGISDECQEEVQQFIQKVKSFIKAKKSPENIEYFLKFVEELMKIKEKCQSK